MSSATSTDIAPGDRESAAKKPVVAWRTNLILFALTVVSVFVTAMFYAPPARLLHAVFEASQFTCSLMAILIAHESGHYIAARIHKVDTSLPYFIPFPVVSP